MYKKFIILGLLSCLSFILFRLYFLADNIAVEININNYENIKDLYVIYKTDKIYFPQGEKKQFFLLNLGDFNDQNKELIILFKYNEENYSVGESIVGLEKYKKIKIFVNPDDLKNTNKKMGFSYLLE